MKREKRYHFKHKYFRYLVEQYPDLSSKDLLEITVAGGHCFSPEGLHPLDGIEILNEMKGSNLTKDDIIAVWDNYRANL